MMIQCTEEKQKDSDVFFFFTTRDLKVFIWHWLILKRCFLTFAIAVKRLRPCFPPGAARCKNLPFFFFSFFFTETPHVSDSKACLHLQTTRCIMHRDPNVNCLIRLRTHFRFIHVWNIVQKNARRKLCSDARKRGSLWVSSERRRFLMSSTGLCLHV